MSTRSHNSRENQRLRRQGERLINVNGEVFYYYIGRTFLVVRGADHKRLWWEFVDRVKGLPPEGVERGRYKGTSDGNILPSEVAAWIFNRQKNGPAGGGGPSSISERALP